MKRRLFWSAIAIIPLFAGCESGNRPSIAMTPQEVQQNEFMNSLDDLLLRYTRGEQLTVDVMIDTLGYPLEYIPSDKGYTRYWWQDSYDVRLKQGYLLVTADVQQDLGFVSSLTLVKKHESPASAQAIVEEWVESADASTNLTVDDVRAILGPELEVGYDKRSRTGAFYWRLEGIGHGYAGLIRQGSVHLLDGIDRDYNAHFFPD